MSLEALLRAQKDEIAQLWVDAALCVYPGDTRKFLRRKKDRFENPVGNRLVSLIPALLDGLLDDASPEELAPHLDPIMQVRCIQDFAPSGAVGFLPRL